MPRQADPNCKNHLHVHARSTVEQRVIGDLKRLAVQDKVELTDLIFEGIQLLFKARNWLPELQQNNPKRGVSLQQEEGDLCGCGRPVERLYLLWQDKTVYRCCKFCLNKIYTSQLQAYAVLENGKTKYWYHTT